MLRTDELVELEVDEQHLALSRGNNNARVAVLISNSATEGFLFIFALRSSFFIYFVLWLFLAVAGASGGVLGGLACVKTIDLQLCNLSLSG